jgi:hypothetical protein
MTEKENIYAQRDAILARLDERTKYIKATLDAHIAEPACEKCDLKDDVAVLENRMNVHRRIGLGFAGVFAAGFKFLFYKLFISA